MRQRIGILGGTFDPVHLGHLILAQEALGFCGLTRIVWVPSGDPPHKAGPVASAEDRFQMVGLAVSDNQAFEVSRIEVDRPGKSYTVETLKDLRASSADDEEFTLLIGTDSAIEMPTWSRPKEILKLAEVTVLARPGFDRDLVSPELAQGMVFLESPLFECSSTDIRNRIRSDRTIRYLVPESVIAYISANELYRA